MAEVEALKQYYIGEGGLLHRVELSVRLTKLRAQVIAAIAATWLPVVALGVGTELIAGRRDPLLRDISVHVRLIVAIPVFLLIDGTFPLLCRTILARLVAASFVSAPDLPRLDRILRRARRLADSTAPELAIAIASLAAGLGGALGWIPIGGLGRRGPLAASQIWYAVTAWPLFQFLLWRSLWRWFVWTCILVGISRLSLKLAPSHPDKRGGLGFLSQPSISYCSKLLFAVSSVMCAEWAEKITIPSIRDLEPLLLAYVLVAVLLAFGPLAPFGLILERARQAGLDQCGDLATAYSRRFEAAHREGLERGDATSVADPEPLAHMTVIFDQSVDRLRVVLFDRRDAIVLLIATLVPMVPAAVAQIPTEDWNVLLKILTGGRLH